MIPLIELLTYELLLESLANIYCVPLYATVRAAEESAELVAHVTPLSLEKELPVNVKFSVNFILCKVRESISTQVAEVLKIELVTLVETVHFIPSRLVAIRFDAALNAINRSPIHLTCEMVPFKGVLLPSDVHVVAS
jgi:hypothetical protein